MLTLNSRVKVLHISGNANHDCVGMTGTVIENTGFLRNAAVIKLDSNIENDLLLVQDGEVETLA